MVSPVPLVLERVTVNHMSGKSTQRFMYSYALNDSSQETHP